MIINKIPNQIITEPLQPLNLNKIDAIALHHMACDLDVKAIEQIHINKGWRAIGYNFWVAFDGTVYEGRGFNLGAGVENQNGHIISIGFQGDYDSTLKIMPDKQFNAGVDIINYVLSKCTKVNKIDGHKAFMATACPGKYFQLAEMKRLKLRSDIMTKDKAKEILSKFLSPETITYLDSYRYGDELIIKLAQQNKGA